MTRRDWTRTALVVVLVLMIVVVSAGAGFAAGWYVAPEVQRPSPTQASQADIQQQFRVFWEAWDIIERDFNRDSPLDTQEMVYGATRGMIESLGDPHTVFIEPAQAEILSQDLAGSFEGIGATVDMIDGYLVIIEPLQDSPAAHAGLLPGDVVLEVDGHSIAGMELMDAIALIRGPENTEVRLLLLREDLVEPLEVAITRASIDLPTVTYRMLDDGIAYVRLAEFNGQATSRLRAALSELQAQNPRALVFDLRSNPGGYLHIAVEVASQFIEDGLIVTEEDARGKVVEYRADGSGLALDIPLAVLVDGGSASATEIVAGAIQDAERGVLVGRPTYGKGSVQVTHTLSDGSAVRVSIARWSTPKGRVLDSDGLTPDILVPADSEAAGDDVVLRQAVEYLDSR